MGAMALVQIIAIAIIGGITVSGGLSVAGAIFVLAYLQRISSHLYMISEIVKGYEQSFLDAQPMTEMLMSSNDVTDKPSAKQLTVTDGAIQFSDVAYRYQDGASDVLTDITFTVQPGQKVGLVGYSGSGKTTITQLLLRFYDVSRGAIAIDGQNIQEVSQTSLRSQISYVPQEPLLFHRSVRDNIAYANPEATTEEIIDATKKANAWDFIQELPEGLDTVVGERGVKLSGGQRQRIAIARAILKNAPILVLDEATSALDSNAAKHKI
ncbi:ATP-binding cassette domain-containing protein [Candidatus Saccharibacteria bacterium]|nr:ATP-binding cassette domain-containing protein [Candidatus Saccharibacteria bacterium]